MGRLRLAATLRLIPAIQSSSRDECLLQYWFASLEPDGQRDRQLWTSPSEGVRILPERRVIDVSVNNPQRGRHSVNQIEGYAEDLASIDPENTNARWETCFFGRACHCLYQTNFFSFPQPARGVRMPLCFSDGSMMNTRRPSISGSEGATCTRHPTMRPPK